MKEQIIFDELRKLVKILGRPDQPPAISLLLKNSISDPNASLALLDELCRQATRPVVFVYEVFGYILTGVEGDVRPRRDPDLAGLRFANQVFMHGINAPAVMCVDDWGKSPNAMRNALERAAEWAENHCSQLAVAIRAIKISNDGRPSFEPNHPIKVCVF